MTLEAWGSLDASLFADGLAAAVRSGATTVLLDLTDVDYFSMKAAAALLEHVGHHGKRYRPAVLASTAVERKLVTLGVYAVVCAQ